MKIPAGLKEILHRMDRKRMAANEAEDAVRESMTDAGYYREISLRYATWQLVAIILLAVFLGVSLLTNASMLSGDNLAFFVRDMTASVSIREDAARDTLVYASDEDNRYELFREGLAVFGDEKLTVFTATGRESYSEYISFATPRLAASGHYLAAYDLGGTSYRLYNSFTCVKRGTAEAAIRTITAANDGSYAIVTDDAEYATRVTLYDDDHRAINRYRLKQYTVCADLSEDGSRLLLGSFSSQNGRMATHLMLATPGRSTADAEWTVTDAYPVAVQLTDDGVMLLSTEFVAWFDLTGKELSRHTFSSASVHSYRLNEYGCVLSVRADLVRADMRVLAFDNEGRQVYNIVTNGAPEDVVLYQETLGVLTSGTLIAYQNGDETPTLETSLTGDYTSILCCDRDEFVLCGPGKAVVMRVK